MKAKLHVIYENSVHDIPAMLRSLADAIAAGEYGEVREMAIVSGGRQLDVFGFGAADGTVTHYLLACGMRKLEDPAL